MLRNIKKRTEISAARSNAANTRWQNPLIAQKTVALATENDSCIKNEREQIDHYLQLWDKEEPGTDPFTKTPAETVRQSLDALIAVIGNKKNLKINGNDVSMQEWLHAIVGCVQDARRRYYIYSIFCEVDERAEMGAIKNKSKYLATAIYNAAKMSGE